MHEELKEPLSKKRLKINENDQQSKRFGDIVRKRNPNLVQDFQNAKTVKVDSNTKRIIQDLKDDCSNSNTEQMKRGHEKENDGMA
jgi:hypothetical protein